MSVCVVVVVVVLQLLLQLHEIMAAHELGELCGIHAGQRVLPRGFDRGLQNQYK